jgi:hypothetical protein
MKCFHLCWVPHLLSAPGKANRVVCAQEMVRVLSNNARTGFKYLLTADESGMHSNQSAPQMRALDRESVDSKGPRLILNVRTMITLFSRINAIALLDLLSPNWRSPSEYFHRNIILALAVEKYLGPSKIGPPRPIPHFANASIHSTNKVGEIVADCDV